MKRGLYLLGAAILSLSILFSIATSVYAEEDPSDTVDPTPAPQITITFEAGENGGINNGKKTVTATAGTAWSEAGIMVPVAVGDSGYEFAGWSPELPDTVPQENTTYTATFKQVIVTFSAGEHGKLKVGEELKSTVEVLIEPGDTWVSITKPTVVVDEGYVFQGWSPLIGTVKISGTYTAKYITEEEKSENESNWSAVSNDISNLLTTTTTTTPTPTKAPSATATPTTAKKSTAKKSKKTTTKSTTLSEAEITTIQVEEEEKVASLRSDEAGVAVYPDKTGGYSFVSGSQLTALGVDKTSDEYKKIIAAAGTEEFIFLKDLSVSNYSGQKMRVAFTVGEEYSGQIVTILHYTGGKVDTTVTRVSERGQVVIDVNSLSPFAIMLGQPVIEEESADVFGKIEEATGLSRLAVILIICAVVILIAIIAIVIILNVDRKKKWEAAQAGGTADLSILKDDFGLENDSNNNYTDDNGDEK